MMSSPPWRYLPDDDRLHLIRRVVDGVAEALCPVRVAVAVLVEPDDDDQPRCSSCVRVFGAERAALGVRW